MPWRITWWRRAFASHLRRTGTLMLIGGSRKNWNKNWQTLRRLRLAAAITSKKSVKYKDLICNPPRSAYSGQKWLALNTYSRVPNVHLLYEVLSHSPCVHFTSYWQSAGWEWFPVQRRRFLTNFFSSPFSVTPSHSFAPSLPLPAISLRIPLCRWTSWTYWGGKLH